MSKPVAVVVLMGLILLFTSEPTGAQQPMLGVVQEQELLTDEQASDFGRSVSLHGDTIAVGAAGGADGGSAHIFVRSFGVWTQQARLSANHGEPLDVFGGSVAVHGDTVAVSAAFDDDNGEDAGAVYVFTRTDGVWTQQAKLFPDDWAAGDYLGVTSIALYEDTLVAGAPHDDDRYEGAGAVYVFTRTNGVWARQAKLYADDARGGDGFGYSVSIEGNTVVIGSPFHNIVWGNVGAAYVFTRTGEQWTQRAKLVAEDGRIWDSLGISVALSGDTVVATAPKDEDNGISSGSAYVFVRAEGAWTQQAKLLPDDGETFDRFGAGPQGVSFVGDTVVITASGADDADRENVGVGYVFVRSNGSWTQRAKLLAGDGTPNDGLGGVSVDGDLAVIQSAAHEHAGCPYRGAAYVFRLRSGPVDLLTDLLERVRELDLHPVIGKGLAGKLEAAFFVLTDLNDANDRAGANMLRAFIHHVEAQAGKKLRPDDADELIAAAEAIVDLLQSR